MTALITDACDDGVDLQWRLFARDREWQWPETPSVFETPGLGVDSHQNFACSSDEVICFGGQAGDRTWGLGLEGPQGPHTCSDCCFDCGAYEYDLGFMSCE